MVCLVYILKQISLLFIFETGFDLILQKTVLSTSLLNKPDDISGGGGGGRSGGGGGGGFASGFGRHDGGAFIGCCDRNNSTERHCEKFSKFSTGTKKLRLIKFYA